VRPLCNVSFTAADATVIGFAWNHALISFAGTASSSFGTTSGSTGFAFGQTSANTTGGLFGSTAKVSSH